MVITEDHGLLMLANANPVPESDIATADIEGALYLAALEQGSSAVTQLDTKKTEGGSPKRPVVWLVAAAAIVVLGVAIFIANQGTEEAPPATESVATTLAEQPEPTVVVEATPTTQAESAPTTTQVLDEWQQIQTLVFAGAAGEYRTDEFAVPFSLTLPNGWADAEDEEDQVELSPTGVFCSGDPGLTDEQVELCRGVVAFGLPQATLEDFVAALTASEDVAELELVEVEVGGIPATWFAPVSTTDQPLIIPVGEEEVIEMWPGDDFRLYFLEVGGENVAIEVRDWEEGTFYEEFQPILDSVVWKEG